MNKTQIIAVMMAILICCTSCAPQRRRRPQSRRDPADDPPEDKEPGIKSKQYHGGHHGHPHHDDKHLIMWKQLIPVLQSAFTSAITNVIVNWFYPVRIVPYPPGKIGISQLWGGYASPYRRRRSADSSKLKYL